MTAVTPDPARLRRALSLEPVRVGAGVRIEGGWRVDHREGCGCPDRLYRGTTCKRNQRPRLDVLDPELLAGLRV